MLLDPSIHARVRKTWYPWYPRYKTIAFSKTNEAGPEAQHLDRTQSNVYLLHTIRRSLTKSTAIRQYYLGFNCLNDNNQLDKFILNV